jgi:hypothetical protein
MGGWPPNEDADSRRKGDVRRDERPFEFERAIIVERVNAGLAYPSGMAFNYP